MATTTMMTTDDTAPMAGTDTGINAKAGRNPGFFVLRGVVSGI